MSVNKRHISVIAIAIGAMLNASLAFADGHRDTGVGSVIAAQGNQALYDIKQELREQLRALGAPETPSPLLESAQRRSNRDGQGERQRSL